MSPQSIFNRFQTGRSSGIDALSRKIAGAAVDDRMDFLANRR